MNWDLESLSHRETRKTVNPCQVGRGSGEPWQVSAVGSALDIPGHYSCSSVVSCSSSDCVPTLWPWVVALPPNCLHVLWLYPEEPLPGPCAALL